MSGEQRSEADEYTADHHWKRIPPITRTERVEKLYNLAKSLESHIRTVIKQREDYKSEVSRLNAALRERTEEVGRLRGDWLIWSNEHRAYWAPNSCGYTPYLERAGRYQYHAARRICERANLCGNGYLTPVPCEVMVPSPELMAKIDSLIATPPPPEPAREKEWDQKKDFLLDHPVIGEKLKALIDQPAPAVPAEGGEDEGGMR